MNKRAVGAVFEQEAADYLRQNGAKIIERNFLCKAGEIDIIARDGEYICFVEVKYRSSDEYGDPEAAVSFAKIRQICKASRFYMFKHKISENTALRYDVVAISDIGGMRSINWIKNAFDYAFDI